MKRLVLIFFVASLFTSCFKDYVCECEGGTVKTHDLDNRSEEEAETECAKADQLNTDPNTGLGSCTLRKK